METMQQEQKINKNEGLKEKIDALRSARSRNNRPVDKILFDEESLNEELRLIIKEIPRGDLQELQKQRITEYREVTQDGAKILEWVRQDKELIMLSFIDGREYLKLPNRAFVVHKMKERVDKMLEKETIRPEDAHSMARLDLDMNGLKALNDLGGHKSGDEGLKLVSEVLKNGETVRWLREQGIEAVASIEGGDELAWLYMEKLI